MSDDPVRVCGECGKVLTGPDTGETVPDWPADATGAGKGRVPGYYKGQAISHGQCEDCGKKGYRQDMRKRYGHLWWRKLGKKSEDE